MTKNLQATLALLALAPGLVGCDGSAARWAPTTVPQATLEPPSNQPGYTLTASSSTVGPGGELRVSWTVPRGGSRDWIGLYGVGAASCDHGWSEYTKGASSGTLTLQAPTRAGQYEFRYQPDDGCDVAARSNPVTVTPGG